MISSCARVVLLLLRILYRVVAELFFAACLCCPIACNIFGIETCICFRDEGCSAGSIFRVIRNIISVFAPFFRREVAIASFFVVLYSIMFSVKIAVFAGFGGKKWRF